ncbi:hypothetical protein BDZ45DRAFT_805212 [Acephala macrosclerotiorum]|nr:hypothetical protein BDZ45DRAFT_805212 [Acephala macrosclerotiorum]
MKLTVAYVLMLTLSGEFSGIPGTNGAYDYVIVGGGIASLTIASRLAEKPSLNIAVVEEDGSCAAQNSMIYSRAWGFFLPFFTHGINYTGTESSTLRASNASVPQPENVSVNATGGPLHLQFSNFALLISYAAEAFRGLACQKFKA